jgi:hypothetical protein
MTSPSSLADGWEGERACDNSNGDAKGPAVDDELEGSSLAIIACESVLVSLRVTAAVPCFFDLSCSVRCTALMSVCVIGANVDREYEAKREPSRLRYLKVGRFT